MIHKVPIDQAQADHTVPAYVAISFFQQQIDQGIKPKSLFQRLLPGASPPPPSPPVGSGNKCHHVGGDFGGGSVPSSIHTIQMSGGGGGGRQGTQGQGMHVNTSLFSGSAGYSSPMNANDPLQNPLNQPSPDQYAFNGFWGFGRARGRR